MGKKSVGGRGYHDFWKIQLTDMPLSSHNACLHGEVHAELTTLAGSELPGCKAALREPSLLLHPVTLS